MIKTRKLKVFLCHSKGDKLKVRKLYYRLLSDGFDAWFDEEKLKAGQNWDSEIRKAVRDADTVVVCLSTDSITKEGYVQKEIGFALDIADEKPEGTIFLIPARLEECNVPNRLSRFQYVELHKRNGYLKLKESLELRMTDLKIRFNSNVVFTDSDQELWKIPVLGKITSRTPVPVLPSSSSKLFVPEDSIEISTLLLPRKVNKFVLFALEIEGVSLIAGMVEDGDILVVEATSKAENGDMVLIWLNDRNETALAYFYEDKNSYRLQPANPKMKPIILKKRGQLETKGKVVMVIRKVDRKP